jgi:hypothetical protein
MSVVESVSGEALGDVARHVFGAEARLLSSRLLGVGSGNLAYLVSLAGQDRRFVFRFNRGFRDDVYESEAANYRLMASATGVRVPEIFAIDRSCTVVPTAYMVLEHLDGRALLELCRPGNSETTIAEKREIRAAAGRFYSRLHAVTKVVAAEESVAFILLGLGRFRAAVEAGYLRVDLDKVQECERVVQDDAGIHSSTLSLCMSDGEMFFARRNGSWGLAFVCDLEWVGFGNRLADVSGQACPGPGLWTLDEPVAIAPDELRRDPFFQTYEESIAIDYEALARLALYTQLSTWGLVAAEAAAPEKKRWIRERKGGVINRLIDLVSSGAGAVPT